MFRSLDIDEGYYVRPLVPFGSGGLNGGPLTLTKPEELHKKTSTEATDCDAALLTRRSWPAPSRSKGLVRVVDLFCGAGGMTLGAFLAAREARLRFEVALAVEKDADVAAIYAANFSRFTDAVDQRLRTKVGIEDFFDGDLRKRPTSSERAMRRQVGRVDLLMGGPPCQGNSDLNNHTRRNDRRNPLYERMARAAEVLEPRVVMIENVPPVVHARGGVVDRAERALRQAGYSTAPAVLPFHRLCVPQSRRRHVLLAVADCPQENLLKVVAQLSEGVGPGDRDVRWAIGDLSGRSEVPGSGTFDAPSKPSADNAERLAWFEDHRGEWILPDQSRPECHRHGGHSYKSIYGRMRWDHPAQTVTTGFGSMGQGCYVHPEEARVITPHEAARLQTFPDFFDFSSTDRRTVWAKAIGNAVPPFGMREVVRKLLSLANRNG